MIRRPSLTRARASSRLSTYGSIPSSDSPAGLSASLPARPRSSSRVSTGSAGSEFGRSRAHAADTEGVIQEEDPAFDTTTAILGAVEATPLDAAKRLLESFITFSVSAETADRYRAEFSHAGPSFTTSSPSRSRAGAAAPSRLSSAQEAKGKAREQSSAQPPSPPSSTSTSSFSRPPTTASSSSPRSTPSSSRPPTPSTPHPSSKSPSELSTSAPGFPSTTTSDRSRDPSTSSADPPPTPKPAPHLRKDSSSSLASTITPRPRPNTIHVSPRPTLSRSATTSHRVPSSPSSRTLKTPTSPNPEMTPFYISPLHRPSTHPRWGALDPEADFGGWGRRIWREDTIRVQVWVRRTADVEDGDGTEKSWKVLKELEIELSRMRKWNGKVGAPDALQHRFHARRV